MRILLLQDVRGVGKRYELKEVSDGYARNFLIAGKLAVPADEKNLKLREEMIKKVQQASKYYAEMAERLKNERMEFLVKAGERGEVFESVNKEMVSERLGAKGYADYEVVLEKPIRSVGDHVLKVRFPGGIKVEMKIIVKPKK